jgi:ribosomal-protein-alanine N-acetyltransferase
MTPSSDDRQGGGATATGPESAPESSDAAIHPAGGLDAPVIAALQNDVFPAEPWSETDVARLIEGPGAIAFLASGRDYGEVMPLAFALARVAADEAEILTIGVLADVRGKGVGRRLVEAVADKARARGARRLHLEVAARNTGARALYADLEFDEVGRRENYYDDRGDGPDDAILLARDLR